MQRVLELMMQGYTHPLLYDALFIFSQAPLVKLLEYVISPVATRLIHSSVNCEYVQRAMLAYLRLSMALSAAMNSCARPPEPSC